MSSDCISAISDAVVAIAAAVGAGIALVGLHTWRAELHGRVEYELAKRTMLEVLKVRDALARLRTSAFFPSEYDDRSGYDQRQAPTMVDKAHAYGKRLARLGTPLQRLEAAVLEAEVHWPGLLAAPFSALRKCVNEVHFSLGQYVATLEPGAEPLPREMLDRLREVVMSELAEEDRIAAEVRRIVDQFSVALRRHLK